MVDLVKEEEFLDVWYAIDKPSEFLGAIFLAMMESTATLAGEGPLHRCEVAFNVDGANSLETTEYGAGLMIIDVVSVP
jgi:hypothetical protein